MDDIKNWIENGADFEEGVALLSKRCRNRFMIDSIVRKRNEKKLRYELGKLLPKQDAPCDMEPPHETGLCDLETMISVKPHERIKIIRDGEIHIKNLPPAIRKVYDEICAAWREMRSLHEGMKQAATDGDRAELRKRLLDLEPKHREGWAIIDKWSEDGIIPEDPKPDPTPDSDPAAPPAANVVNAAKTNVTRTLKKLDTEQDPAKRDELIEKLRPWVATIQAAGGNFTGNAAKLSELGLIPPIQA